MAAINRSEGTSCNAFRGDLAWKACERGAVYASRARTECICRRSDASPMVVPCPAP
jgi:hypothetical protein